MALTALIDIDDFSNPYLIFEGEAGTGDKQFFDDLILKYQDKIIKKILGPRLYNDMVANYPDGDFWDDFVDGVEYTENDIDYVYAGIKPVLVLYIYYWWERNNASRLQEAGELVQGFEESEKVIPANKMASAYNEMCLLIENPDSYEATVYQFLLTQYDGTEWVYKQTKPINEFNF